MSEYSYVRDKLIDARAAPPSSTGVWGWIRANLFNGPVNTVLTLLAAYVIYVVAWPLIDFVFVNGVWTGADRTACTTGVQGGIQPDGWFGGCWTYVHAYFAQFMYGPYPFEDRWRVNITAVLLVFALIAVLVPKLPFKNWALLYAAFVFPVAAIVLLTGGHFELGGFFFGASGLIGLGGDPAFFVDLAIVAAIAVAIGVFAARATGSEVRGMVVSILAVFAVIAVIVAIFAVNFGLERVETGRWGGLLVTMVLSVTGIAVSLPLGVVLALGRRSQMPVVRTLSVIFIEFWRGVPLITVLFMSSVMLPLFLPEDTDFDKLLRALIGVALFASAYMAEVVRGGLQAMPRGQYEGAMALGLTYWQMMRMIILPQALKMVIPGIVSTFIGLFKDTTLVLIIGLFDFLGMIQSSFANPKWASPVQALTGYAFAAFTYWIFTFSMSRYSIYTEKRLHTGHKR